MSALPFRLGTRPAQCAEDVQQWLFGRTPGTNASKDRKRRRLGYHFSGRASSARKPRVRKLVSNGIFSDSRCVAWCDVPVFPLFFSKEKTVDPCWKGLLQFKDSSFFWKTFSTQPNFLFWKCFDQTFAHALYWASSHSIWGRSLFFFARERSNLFLFKSNNTSFTFKMVLSRKKKRFLFFFLFFSIEFWSVYLE